MEVVYLKSQGLAHQELRRLCRISKSTLTTYLKSYQAGGIEGLKHLGYHGQPSALRAHEASLETEFRDHPPHTVVEASVKSKALTGIERSPTQVRAFLKRLGMRCRKVGGLPGHALETKKQAEQALFKKTN